MTDICNGCSVGINAGTSFVMAGPETTNKYHPDCFKCEKCSTKLESEYGINNDMILCINCNLHKAVVVGISSAINETETEVSERMPELVCKTCSKRIIDQNNCVHAHDQVFHEGCISCKLCEKSLYSDGGDGTFIVRDGERFHVSCDAKTAKKCNACQEVFNGSYLTLASGTNVHSECFNCSSCKGSLAKGYMTKEDQHLCNSCFTAM